MRVPRWIMGPLMAAVAVTTSLGTMALAADQKSALEARERSCAAAGAMGTVEQAMECYSSSPEVVAYDGFTPREFDGPEAIRGYFTKFFANGYRNVKLEFVSLHVVTDGTIGYTSSIQHWNATAANGMTIDAVARVSDVWRQENGRWVIVHTHASFPVDPMTYKADLHSQP